MFPPHLAPYQSLTAPPPPLMLRKSLQHPAITLCSFPPCHLSSLRSHSCTSSLPCYSYWAGLCWLLPFICAEREQLTFPIRVLQTSPITRVQQTLIPLPGISSSPLDPQRVSNPNSLLAHDVPALPDSTQPLCCCLFLPQTSTQGTAFSPQGKLTEMQNSLGRGKAVSPVAIPERGAARRAGREMSHTAAPPQAKKTCAAASLCRPAHPLLSSFAHSVCSCTSWEATAAKFSWGRLAYTQERKGRKRGVTCRRQLAAARQWGQRV